MKIKQYKIKTLVPEMNWKTDDDSITYNCNNRLGIKNVKCVETNLKFLIDEVCFNYALNDDMIESISEAISYLSRDYKLISISQARNNDIITYSDKYGEVEHFAKIYETNNTLKSTIIRSKWGRCGVFETDLYSVPKEYGNFIRIWGRKTDLDNMV